MSKQCDEESFVKKYMYLVRIIARKFYLAGAEQEDVIQEGMVGLLSAVRHYRDDQEASFVTFAERCIKNQIKSVIKAANAQKHEILNNAEDLEDVERVMCGVEKDPEDEIICRETNEERNTKIAKLLSPMEKKVLKEYLEGYSYEEIANHLQITCKSVDNGVQRIRKKLCDN